MKAFTFKDNSWHFWVVNFGEKRINPNWGDTDICEYIRCFFRGLFWLFVTTFIICGFTTWVLVSIGNVIGTLFLGYKIEPYAVVFLLMLTGGAMAFGIVGSIKWYSERQAEKNRLLREAYYRGELKEPEPKEPGFLTLAYRKFKDKTCVRIKIEKTDD